MRHTNLSSATSEAHKRAKADKVPHFVYGGEGAVRGIVGEAGVGAAVHPGYADGERVDVELRSQLERVAEIEVGVDWHEG